MCICLLLPVCAVHPAVCAPVRVNVSNVLPAGPGREEGEGVRVNVDNAAQVRGERINVDNVPP